MNELIFGRCPNRKAIDSGPRASSVKITVNSCFATPDVHKLLLRHSSIGHLSTSPPPLLLRFFATQIWNAEDRDGLLHEQMVATKGGIQSASAISTYRDRPAAFPRGNQISGLVPGKWFPIIRMVSVADHRHSISIVT